MTTFKTPELIDSLQKQTEDFLQQAIIGWQTTSPSKLLRQPAPDKWSAAQCLEHLNSYGRYYLPEIEKSIETATARIWIASEQFKAGLLGEYFTKIMTPAAAGRKMKKMSAPKDHVPDVKPDGDKVISEFIEQQERLLVLLEKARKINIQKAKVPISIAKFVNLKLGDTFRFLIAHNHRHILQAQRALAEAVKREYTTISAPL